MQLSPHFQLIEFTKSQTATRLGIDNTPDAEHIANLRRLCLEVLEPLRDSMGKPISVSSGYRSRDLNEAVKGSPTSQHCNGMAADIEVFGHDNCDLAQFIVDNMDFDQVILEFHHHEAGPNDGWVHVSYNHNNNRHDVLTARRQAGQVVYLQGLVR